MDNRKTPYLLIIPGLLLILLTMGLGIVYCFIQSLGYFPLVGLEHITGQYYWDLFQSKVFLEGLFFSLYTSLVVTIITVLICVYISYAFLHTIRRKFEV